MKKKIEDFTEEDWDVLEETGMLWELYPDAPETWSELQRRKTNESYKDYGT